MSVNPRHYLAACAGLGAWASAGAAIPQLMAPSSRRRVVVVGGGWAGLAAARRLRELAPELDTVLVERNAAFWSGPLSNRWLAGQVATRLLVHDYRAAALAFGYTLVRAEVSAIDRAQRRVVTSLGVIDYDWLVLATGIRYAFESWFGDDQRAIDHVLRQYPSAFIPGAETEALKRKLDGFSGGDLLMTLPPAPYRCPPAPYERACLIGWLLKSRRIKGKLIVLDPNPAFGGYDRTFAERYRDQIVYLPQTPVKTVDPFRRIVVTEFDEFRFDDAILMAPQQSSDLVRQAGLAGKDSAWAAQDSVHLHAVDDERVFLVGDLMGQVSPLFGQYPKSGALASATGRIAAAGIAAQSRGAAPPRLLPESNCHIFTDFDPAETTRIEARYRIRGDGLIVQTVKQQHDPNPRDEDVQWAKAQFAELLAYRE